MEILSYIIFSFGLILSVKTYFYETGHRGANRFLAAFLFGTSFLFFEVFHYFLCNSSVIAAFTLGGVHQITFLLGPFAYLYVRGTLRDNARLKRAELLHFVPFFVVFMGHFPYFLSPWEEKLIAVNLLCARNWLDFSSLRLNFIASYTYLEFFRILSILVYGGAQWALILNYRKPADWKDPSMVQYIIVRRWLIIFIALYSVMAAQRIGLGSILMMVPGWSMLERVGLLTCISLSIFYLILNFGAFIFNNLLNGLVITPAGHLKKNSSEIAYPSHALLPESNAEEAVHSWYESLFQPEYLQEIGHLLDKWSENKKFLGRANLADLSSEIGIPSHHLTYYFNNILGLKFPDWRNSLRIAHAKSLIDEGIMEVLNIEGLANTCGYSSRTTFSRVFKEITGLSPSEYNESRALPPSNQK
jgi:AraC-like DNA-binding protein